MPNNIPFGIPSDVNGIILNLVAYSGVICSVLPSIICFILFSIWSGIICFSIFVCTITTGFPLIGSFKRFPESQIPARTPVALCTPTVSRSSQTASVGKRPR